MVVLTQEPTQLQGSATQYGGGGTIAPIYDPSQSNLFNLWADYQPQFSQPAGWELTPFSPIPNSYNPPTSYSYPLQGGVSGGSQQQGSMLIGGYNPPNYTTNNQGQIATQLPSSTTTANIGQTGAAVPIGWRLNPVTGAPEQWNGTTYVSATMADQYPRDPITGMIIYPQQQPLTLQTPTTQVQTPTTTQTTTPQETGSAAVQMLNNLKAQLIQMKAQAPEQRQMAPYQPMNLPSALFSAAPVPGGTPFQGYAREQITAQAPTELGLLTRNDIRSDASYNPPPSTPLMQPSELRQPNPAMPNMPGSPVQYQGTPAKGQYGDQPSSAGEYARNLYGGIAEAEQDILRNSTPFQRPQPYGSVRPRAPQGGTGGAINTPGISGSTPPPSKLGRFLRGAGRFAQEVSSGVAQASNAGFAAPATQRTRQDQYEAELSAWQAAEKRREEELAKAKDRKRQLTEELGKGERQKSSDVFREQANWSEKRKPPITQEFYENAKKHATETTYPDSEARRAVSQKFEDDYGVRADWISLPNTSAELSMRNKEDLQEARKERLAREKEKHEWQKEKNAYEKKVRAHKEEEFDKYGEDLAKIKLDREQNKLATELFKTGEMRRDSSDKAKMLKANLLAHQKSLDDQEFRIKNAQRVAADNLINQYNFYVQNDPEYNDATDDVKRELVEARFGEVEDPRKPPALVTRAFKTLTDFPETAATAQKALQTTQQNMQNVMNQEQLPPTADVLNALNAQNTMPPTAPNRMPAQGGRLFGGASQNNLPTPSPAPQPQPGRAPQPQLNYNPTQSLYQQISAKRQEFINDVGVPPEQASPQARDAYNQSIDKMLHGYRESNRLNRKSYAGGEDVIAQATAEAMPPGLSPEAPAPQKSIFEMTPQEQQAYKLKLNADKMQAEKAAKEKSFKTIKPGTAAPPSGMTPQQRKEWDMLQNYKRLQEEQRQRQEKIWGPTRITS